jgi:CDP-paratose 2-epimerase
VRTNGTRRSVRAPAGASPRAPLPAQSGGPAASDRLGLVEFLHLGDRSGAERVMDGLAELGVGRLRTAISWADWHAPGGAEWYRWLIPELGRRVELLPCVTYTPPSLGRLPKTSSPPRETRAYADFLDELVDELGEWFEWIELWNEPNNLNDWDWKLDHEWRLFSDMIGKAAYWMRRRGKKTVLGGMCPTDPNWLRLMCERGLMQHIDAVGLHAFPETWQAHWAGWEGETAPVRAILREFGHEPPLWITEVGYATWRHDEVRQVGYLKEALQSEAERVYWYSLRDLDDARESQEGFHFDDRHYHTGIQRADGTPKLLYRLLAKGGLPEVHALDGRIRAPHVKTAGARTLVTGGLGFVGSNLTARLVERGRNVLVYDSLARAGAEENLAWLRETSGHKLGVEIADVRNRHAAAEAVAEAAEIYHLAAQVAVTTSVVDPRTDFEVNAGGTLNLLEAMRRRSDPPGLLFTSTNKVYGDYIGADDLAETATRYVCTRDRQGAGVDETQPIDLYSPYGCSKGAADQYVLDYARIYDLPAAVFRMSCIYGPRQFGTEDQGWVAHFLRSALDGRPLTVFGDGKQVRDLLFVDDLIEALTLCQAHMGACRGKAFNIGGGPDNSVSLLELLDLLEQIGVGRPEVAFADWRPGDQLLYLSDTRRFRGLTGWAPRVSVQQGLQRLAGWLGAHVAPVAAAVPATRLAEPAERRASL